MASIPLFAIILFSLVATTGAMADNQSEKCNGRIGLTNLNRETAKGMVVLIGYRYGRAIVHERERAPFRNWDDFLARNVLPPDRAAVIKECVEF